MGTADLDAADMPFLDELAQKGETGLLEGIGEIRPEALDGAGMKFVKLATSGGVAGLERLDRSFFGPLIRQESLPEQVVAVVGQVVTVVGEGGESASPVLISCGSLEPEGTLKFCTAEAAHGHLGVLHGADLVARLLDLARA